MSRAGVQNVSKPRVGASGIISEIRYVKTKNCKLLLPLPRKRRFGNNAATMTAVRSVRARRRPACARQHCVGGRTSGFSLFRALPPVYVRCTEILARAVHFPGDRFFFPARTGVPSGFGGAGRGRARILSGKPVCVYLVVLALYAAARYSSVIIS